MHELNISVTQNCEKHFDTKSHVMQYVYISQFQGSIPRKLVIQ